MKNQEQLPKEAYRAAMETVIGLCRCAMNRTVPPKELTDGADLEQLYKAAEKHLLTAVVGMTLEETGIRTEAFSKAIAKAQRKNALLDTDRKKVQAELEWAGIWYMPLKGAVLKDLYPRYGMRQMSDIDILIDPERRADVRKIMEGLGFSTEQYKRAEHDVYHKKPVSNFEMHVYLINGESNDQLTTYYLDVKDRLIKDEGNQYGYHFSDEDAYLFLTAHGYKHYVNGGTGLRSLLDTYVYIQHKGKELDWDYIRQEAISMGMEDYEQTNRSLSVKLFSGKPLAEPEKKMLEYICSSGAYGTIVHHVENQIQKNSRLQYFLSRLILPKKDMVRRYPVLEKAPVLYPAVCVWRLINRAVVHNGKIRTELKAILGSGNHKQD